MTRRFEIPKQSRQRGFTLIESVIVIGLTALIAVGIVAGLLEGLDTLHTVTDTQGVEFQHQRTMTQFIEDVQSATWFYNGTSVEEEGEAETNRETVGARTLIMGWPGPAGEEIWVRYSTSTDVQTEETYLIRTVVTLSGDGQGSTILSTGVANLLFDYLDANGETTDMIIDVRRVIMTLAVNVGGATVERDYEVTMRNPNYGVREPPGDFDEVQDEYYSKYDFGHAEFYE
jgi:prepilin-type N-terminal cleavage/methylation domain-containing protein